MSERKLVSSAKGATRHSLEDFFRMHDTLLKITKEALSTCLGCHETHCPPHPIDPTEFLPTRLVDLEAVERPRLILTSESEIRDRRYVPVSHQWGTPDEDEKRQMTTTVSSLESRKSGFKLSTLPSRYQAVIMLCHAMDIRYIWIDSLCIIQVCSTLSSLRQGLL
jgi:Heterokaryon incompatibility protein (HET)